MTSQRVFAPRWIATIATGLLLVAATLYVAHASGTSSPPTANAAHVIDAKDQAHLHLTSTNGSLLIEEGPVTGAIPGTVKANFTIAANVTSTFTIYARSGGSITGQGSGALHSTGTTSSFGGSLKVTGGSGRYKHAHGTGGFSGQINRKTFAVTVQTSGKLSY